MSIQVLRKRLANPTNSVFLDREHVSLTRSELEAALAEYDRMRLALEACEMVMDTVMLHDLSLTQLPPAYRESWSAAHVNARVALAHEAPTQSAQTEVRK